MRILLCSVIAFLGLVGGGTAATVAEVAADPQRWPAEVVVPAAIKATIVRDGQPAGAMLVGAGSKIVVSEITTEMVTGKLGGTTVRVPVARTNLSALAATVTVTVVPAPTPAVSVGAKAKVAATTTAMQRMFGGSLVRCAGGVLQEVDASALDGVKYYALYYSASWCGPCRQFTPSLVTAYRELKRAHPEFELIFVSADHSAGDMADYMKDDAMPWLAVKFNTRDAKMVDYCGPGIPCLVLVDAHCNVLSDSFQGENYLGPRHVLADTQRILAEGRP